MSSNAATFAEERRAAILDMLEHSASVQVSDLAHTFGVSAVTARADLDALEAAGKLRRTHGGAVSLHKALTVSIQDKRINLNVAAKQAIAQTAIELVEDGDSIIVDSGTTALEFVRALTTRRDITVITADVTIANYIDDSLPQTDVILLGGTLRKGHRYLYGPLALRALEVLHADKAFLCPTSLVPNRGLMTNFDQMAQVKRCNKGRCRRPHAIRAARKNRHPRHGPRSRRSCRSPNRELRRERKTYPTVDTGILILASSQIAHCSSKFPEP